MCVLTDLQRSLEELHDVQTQLEVTAYIVGDDLRDEIPGARAGLPEQLFVREVEGDLELALYLAPEVVAALERDDPRHRLHAGNLDSFCVALEGVSHFVLVVHRARYGRPVSVLELEIQAEVDKFVAAWLLLCEQGAAVEVAAKRLSRQLFDAYRLREAVPADQARRYHVASRVAKRYCRRLWRRYGRDRDRQRLTRDLRGFYRRGLAEKMRAA